MMRKNLRQAQSFITFDLPVNTNHIGSLFTNTHYYHLSSIPNWSSRATRKKVIAKYWFEYVLSHFAILLGLATLFSMPFINILHISFLPSLFMVGTISFVVLFVMNYWPNYYRNFLPNLDSLVDDYEKQHARNFHEKWLAQLQSNFTQEYKQVAAQREELAKELQHLEAKQKEQVKCRKEQLSTLALALIFYVLDKTSGMNGLQCNDPSATSLTKLFGKDPGGIKDSLQLIFGKKQNLSPRHRTEILNRFNEAYQFFEENGFKEGIQILQSLELKFKEKH